MEGFGSETLMMPYYYGSVADGMSRGSTLEQRLKKKYWKTKQAVIQKLGKSQDEFVVAGDADIDTKLEVRRWYPLGMDNIMSCTMYMCTCLHCVPCGMLIV